VQLIDARRRAVHAAPPTTPSLSLRRRSGSRQPFDTQPPPPPPHPPPLTNNQNNRESGDPKKARPYLPPTKQFLVTRGVPCLRRAADLERAAPPGGGDARGEYALAGEDEGWTATHRDPRAAGGAAASGSGTASAAPAAPKAADDGVPDLADLDISADEATVVPTSSAAAHANKNAATVATRTYDLHVTYDQYYRVPRMWLVGYDESGAPLRPEQVLEDVSEDHARKTITAEPHPHGGASAGVQAASIHPCRHAEVMKRLAERAAEGYGGEKGAPPLTVERYLVLFLKFIASVVPTIQYDYTMET